MDFKTLTLELRYVPIGVPENQRVYSFCAVGPLNLFGLHLFLLDGLLELLSVSG